MSGPTAGARLGYVGDEARVKGSELLNNFFAGFPGVKTAIDQSKAFLKEHGYVEDFVGRRRRLSDINLAPYKVEATTAEDTFNPILECQDRIVQSAAVTNWEQILDSYVILSQAYHIRAAKRDIDAWNKEHPDEPRVFDAHNYECDNEMASQTFNKFKAYAADPEKKSQEQVRKSANSTWSNAEKLASDLRLLSGILTDRKYYGTDLSGIPTLDALIDTYIKKYGYTIASIPRKADDAAILSAWTGKIAQAGRQCFNARIQGSAASLTKLAMIDIFNDQRLRQYGARLIITVHDEVLVECPAVYADEVEKILPEIMIAAAKKVGDEVPQSCDPYNVTRWYSDVEGAALLEELKKLEKAKPELTHAEAMTQIVAAHPEFPEQAIMESLTTGADLIF